MLNAVQAVEDPRSRDAVAVGGAGVSACFWAGGAPWIGPHTRTWRRGPNGSSAHHPKRLLKTVPGSRAGLVWAPLQERGARNLP